jgi:hypothetical protein
LGLALFPFDGKTKMPKKKIAKVWTDMVTKKDAVLLCKWWNAHSPAKYQEYEIRRSPTNPRFWAVYKV